MTILHRKTSTATLVIGLLLAGVSANAQPPGQRTMGKYGWRWHDPVQFDRNVTLNLPVSVSPWPVWPYWDYGGWYGYGYAAPNTVQYGIPYTPQWSYGSPTFSGMNPVWSQRQPAAVSAPSNEQALLNHVRSIEARRQLREEVENRNAERDDERRARGLARPEKRPTDLYVRLSSDQLDFTTGAVSWPESLLREEFDSDRNRIEKAMTRMVEHGPDKPTAAEIRETANQMKTTSNSLLAEMGFETYTETRRFLSSLSVEGYYALEQ